MTPAQEEAVNRAAHIIRDAFSGEKLKSFTLEWAAGKPIEFKSTALVRPVASPMPEDTVRLL